MIISKKVNNNNNNKNIKIIAIKLQLKCMSIVLIEQSQTTQTHPHSNEKPIFLYGICISLCYVIRFFSSLVIFFSCLIYAAAKIYSVQQHYLHIQRLIFRCTEIQYRNTLQMIIIYYYYYSLNLLESLILENIMHTQHTLQI